MFDSMPMILAQENLGGENTSTSDPADKDGGKEGSSSGSLFGGGGGMFFPLIIGMVVLMFILTTSGQRKQKKKQASMIASMSKGSKVVTTGGIKGSIVEVRDDEVVVKVDESNNTRMRFTKDAIRSVISDEAS